MSVYDKAYELRQDIKNAVRSHLSIYASTSISTSTSFSDYQKIVASANDVVKGSFTPTEDKDSITITELPVMPFYIYIECKELCTSTKPSGYETAIIFVNKLKSNEGELKYYNNDGVGYVQKIPKNGYVTFGNGTITVKPYNSGKVFRAGFTYDYYIIGGNM